MEERPVRLGVDVGGTFTDVVLVSAGEVTTAKVPTTADQSEGVVDGIRAACDTAGIEPESIDSFRHAMTVATNAMLEVEGAETALVTTDGFGDLLAIGRQDRPSLYDLSARKPDPLVPSEHRYEIEERATESGIEKEPTESDLAALLDEIDETVESVAVSFLHAYAQPDNERRVADYLRTETDSYVVASHEVLPEFREYERTATTVAAAYVTPIISEYLGRLERKATALGVPAPEIMQSNGGIAETEQIRDQAVTTVLSGPAGGVVGASLFEENTHEGIITFDMGGTSSDVSLVRNGTIERTTEGSVGEYPVHVPMVDIQTVGAGGGSIAWIDEGGALRVGPRSAGAEPGPACYGNGGTEPTVTDANLLLGYLGADTELGDGLSLDESAAADAFEHLVSDSSLDSTIEAARGTYRIANERMARAVRAVTVQQGHDPREFALVAFGGAGPMHAAALAESLGVETIRVPLANGVLSALGLLAAPERHDASQTIHELLETVDPETVEETYSMLAERVYQDVTDPENATLVRQADLRYEGQSHELPVEIDEPFDRTAVREQFHDAHERARGYRLADEPVEIVTVRLTATISGDEPEITYEGTNETVRERRDAYFDGSVRETRVFEREQIPAGATIDGPAIFEGGESTVVVKPGWTAAVDERGTLTLEKSRREER
jgi:N-methylhydantoinase A